ncbi:MFS transporter [Paenibacillus donghaensis]|uniref:MFS transporter n=1 Tax=Paenibacillus donghaensis TaxID=414771 RepID=A0A2Z2KI19_9BACL|nr:MFS transporter [Paenibacillus donghaensis]ASA19441.1 MFS transporter [Paenibacillus donghaensis]
MSQSTAYRATAGKPYVFRESLVVSMLGFVIVLVVMNTMMFNLALPQITKEFALSTIASSWIVTGYSIVFAIMSITFSRLSDFVPIRTLFIVGLSLFGAASLIGLFSESFAVLLSARLLQAAGAASVPGLAIVLITRYVPAERRGNSMAVIISASSLGLGLGPVIGGTVTQFLGWHNLFIITGISLLLIPLFLLLIPKEAPQKGSFDLLGAACIGIGTTGVLLFLTSRSWVTLAVGVIALLLFWLRIHRAHEPFVQPELFRNRKYLSLIALGIVSYINNFATLYLLPQVLAHLYGLTPAQSGLIIFPGAIVSMLLSNRVGRIINRYGNGLFIRYSPWLLIVAAALFALLAGTTFYAIAAVYILLSIGFSTLTTSVSNEVSEILPVDEIGAGMGFFQLVQFFGGAFSVAMTSIALSFQQSRPLGMAYSNIFWGMTVTAALAIACSLIYASYQRRAGRQS